MINLNPITHNSNAMKCLNEENAKENPMELRLDEIKGLMVEQNNNFIHEFEVDGIKYKNINPKIIGFNEALTQQGKRKITMNRERLARYLWSKYAKLDPYKGFYVTYDSLNDEDKQYWLNEADCQRSHLNELIEVAP